MARVFGAEMAVESLVGGNRQPQPAPSSGAARQIVCSHGGRPADRSPLDEFNLADFLLLISCVYRVAAAVFDAQLLWLILCVQLIVRVLSVALSGTISGQC